MNHLPRSAFGIVLALTGALTAQDPISVRVDQEPGAKLHYRVHTVLEQTIDMGGQMMDVGSDTTHVLQLEVKERKDGGALSIVARVLRTSGSTTLPMIGDVEFDSAAKATGDAEGVDDFGPSTGAIKQALTALAGREFTAAVTPQGKIGEIDGVAAFVDAARAKAGPMGAQMLGGVINEGVVRHMLEGVFVEVPESAVPGKPWKLDGTREGSRGMALTIDGEMVIESADADQVTVKSASKLHQAPAAKPAAAKKADADEDADVADIRAMIAKMKVEKASASSKGTLSRKDGMVLNNRLELAMSMTMPSPMGGDMLIDQKTVTTVARISAEEASAKKEK